MFRLVREYKRIAKKITRLDIQQGADEDELTLDSLLNFGRFQSKSNFFLGVFSNSGLKYILERFRIVEELGKRGLNNISTELETTDSHTHKLYVYSGAPNPSNVICELVAKKGPLTFEEGLLPNYPTIPMSFLQIEWLLLQNPRKRFSDERPRLPGQSYPGLGLGKELMILLMIMAKNIGLDGITNKPHFFHTAFIFTRMFVFVDPYKQAEMEALNRDLLKQYKFNDIAWAAYFECIINNTTNEVFKWDPGFLVFPMSKKVYKYFNSKDYKKTVARYRNEMSFSIDEKKYQKKLQMHEII